MSDAPSASRGPIAVAWLATLVAAIVATLATIVALGYRTVRTELGAARSVPATRPSPAPGRSAAAGSGAAVRPAAPAPAANPAARPAAPRFPEPRYAPEDATRSPQDAYRELVSASTRGDAATVAKYLLRAELARKQPAEDAMRELQPPVPIDGVEIVRGKTAGDRAAFLVNVKAPRVVDAQGKPAPIQVVVRMAREDGHWKLFRQTWLINSALGSQESEATAWVAAKPAPKGSAGEAVQKLRALGVTYDMSSFQSAVARGNLEQVRLFLQAGMSPATKLEGGNGESLFSLALLGMPGDPAHEEIALAMIESGSAPVEERTPTGMTPLARAASVCKPRVVAALLRAGVDPSPVDNFKKTPRQWAKAACPAAEKLLKDAGAK